MGTLEHLTSHVLFTVTSVAHRSEAVWSDPELVLTALGMAVVKMTSVPILKSLLGALMVPFVLCKLSSEYVRCRRLPRRLEGGLD